MHLILNNLCGEIESIKASADLTANPGPDPRNMQKQG